MKLKPPGANDVTLKAAREIYPDAETGYIVNLDADDNETSRWPVAFIPRMGLVVLLMEGRLFCYAADSLADARPKPGARLLPVPLKLLALLPGEEPMMPDDEVLNVEEVAELLKVKPKTVWKWKKDRGLPFVKIGTATRYMRSDVMAWVASHKQRQGE